jgi:hypothetical protein
MKSKIAKGLLDKPVKLVVTYNDNTTIELHTVSDFDFEINTCEYSVLEFTSEEISKYMFNRLLDKRKNTISKIKVYAKIYDLEHVPQYGGAEEYECEYSFKGIFKMRTVRLLGMNSDDFCSMSIRLEGVVN